MRVACIQPNLRFGDIEYNVEQIAACAVRARNAGAHLVVMPHLGVLGGWIMEGWRDDAILEAQQHAIQILQQKGLGLTLLGSALRIEGRQRMFLAYAIPSDLGSPVGWFAENLRCALTPDFSVRFDWWDGSSLELATGLRPRNSSSLHVVFDTSYAGTGQPFLDPSMVTEETPVVVVRPGGIRGHHLCLQGSEFVFAKGTIVAPAEADTIKVVDLAAPAFEPLLQLAEEEHWYSSLVRGIREFFATQGLRKALVGLSGGIDSALVLTLAVEALGRENVMAVFMPSQFTSSVSTEDAAILADRLGVEFHRLPIDALCAQIEASLGTLLDGSRGTAEENIQARTRGLLLMAIANKRGFALLNTSNKSEIAVGYTTMYGDMCGVLSAIGDLYKTQVYQLSRWINREREIIPQRTITRPPSAELRPDQTDQDALPSYDVLDAILRELLDDHPVPFTVDRSVRQKVTSLLQGSAFKRQQMAPILKITSVPFQSAPEQWVPSSKCL